MGTDVRPRTPSIDSALMMAGYAAGDIARELEDLAAPQLEVLVPALAATVARFESVRLRALHAADEARVGARAGMATTADWAAAVSGEKRGKARADVELADKLSSLTAVAEAPADGSVSKAQATALADAERPSEAEQHELVDAAGSLSVHELERRVSQFNLGRARPPEPVVPSVTLTPMKQGVSATVTLDALGGEMFTTALDAAAQKLSFEKGTPLAQRRAAGLTAISRYFLEHHAEVSHRLGRPHVVANIPIATLVDETATEGAVLASGAVIDAATARQLACDASISRLITGPNSEPLDVGRATRSIPTAMARQLIIEDQHCRWPGCTSPVWSCEGHHVRFWEPPHCGETKLGNLALLWHHHHLLHKDPGWQLTLDPVSRRLTVAYRGRLVGSTDPAGRHRQPGPVVAPALRTTARSRPSTGGLADAPRLPSDPDGSSHEPNDVLTLPLDTCDTYGAAS